MIAGASNPASPLLQGAPFASSLALNVAEPGQLELTHTRAVADRPDWSIPSIFADETPWAFASVPEAAAHVSPGARWSRVEITDALPRWSPPVERPSTLNADFDARQRVGLLFGADRSSSTLARFIPAPGPAAIWIGAIGIGAPRRRGR